MASGSQNAPLSKLAFFKGVPSSRLRAIERRSSVRHVPAGHVFFNTGESGEGLFLLEMGSVQTFRASPKKKLIVAELNAPAVFGEMGCVGRCSYHCTAQATTPARIRIIPRGDVEALLARQPMITRRLLNLVSERFVQVLLDLDAASFRHLIPRIAAFLLDRADGDVVRNLTHRDLAQYLRVYRESATSALGELKKAGIISVKRKEIRILHRARLERAAREGSGPDGRPRS